MSSETTMGNGTVPASLQCILDCKPFKSTTWLNKGKQPKCLSTGKRTQRSILSIQWNDIQAQHNDMLTKGWPWSIVLGERSQVPIAIVSGALIWKFQLFSNLQKQIRICWGRRQYIENDCQQRGELWGNEHQQKWAVMDTSFTHFIRDIFVVEIRCCKAHINTDVQSGAQITISLALEASPYPTGRELRAQQQDTTPVEDCTWSCSPYSPVSPEEVFLEAVIFKESRQELKTKSLKRQTNLGLPKPVKSTPGQGARQNAFKFLNQCYQVL